MEIKKMSFNVLAAYWNDLLIKFEKNESDHLIEILNQVEEEMNKRRINSCSH